MIQLSEDFISETQKVRTSGNSLIITLKNDNCILKDAKAGTMVQVYWKPIGFVEPRKRMTPPFKEEDFKDDSPKPEQPPQPVSD